MKLIFIIIVLTISRMAIADCPEQRKIKIESWVTLGSVKAGGNHGYFDAIFISMPTLVDELKFSAIELTAGEVAEFWIPLAVELDGDKVIAKLFGDKSTLDTFEYWVTYSDGICFLSQNGSVVSAYNQRLLSTAKKRGDNL